MSGSENRELVEYRLQQAQVALDDARFLLEGRRSAQSIINRSYYAMFYAVLALLQETGNIPSKHTGAISLFDTEFVAKGTFPRDLSKDLHRAFELRQTSDYRVIDATSSEAAEDILNKAVRFVRAVNEHLLPPKLKRG